MDNWSFSANMECDKCKAERLRRCCILRAGADATFFERRLQSPPFDVAPFVHPFRYPSFHATQLRAISFAKTNNQQVFWVAAYDKERVGEMGMDKMKEKKAFPERQGQSFAERIL